MGARWSSATPDHKSPVLVLDPKVRERIEHHLWSKTLPLNTELADQLESEAVHSLETLDIETTRCKAPSRLGFRVKQGGGSWPGYEGSGAWDSPCPTIGSLICEVADRVPDWNHGFVVAVDWLQSRLAVIYPRFRVEGLGEEAKIVLGQDRLTEKSIDPKHYQTCRCETYYLCDGFCSCGAREQNQALYDQSFRAVDPTNQEYQIQWLPLKNQTCGILFEYSSPPETNNEIPKCGPVYPQ